MPWNKGSRIKKLAMCRYMIPRVEISLFSGFPFARLL